MRKHPRLLAALLLATCVSAAPPAALPAVAADGLTTIPIETYDVAQTPVSGYGYWFHTYTGTIVDTGRTIPYFPIDVAIADYSGGSGTINDGITSTDGFDTHLLNTGLAVDGLPIRPVITLHLAQLTRVKRISIYGGDVPYNIIPGALNAMTIEIEDKLLFWESIPFGPANAAGSPANDLFDINGSDQSWTPTRTIVLKDFRTDFDGWLDQFSISEIVVEGWPITEVAIDVKPGDKDPVHIVPGWGKIPVAIMGSPTFDVTKIDANVLTLTFGVLGWENSLSDCSGPKDLNRDGVLDRVCHFANYRIDWTQGFTQVHLNGETTDGVHLYGTDTIRP